MVVNLCFFAPPRTNVGDRFTHPTDYFTWGFETRKYPLGTPATTYLLPLPSVVIVGGGGVVRDPKRNDWFTLSRIAAEVPHEIPLVIWGMGINDYGRLDVAYDVTLDFIETRPNVLVGLRDRFHRNYLPCASCMRPEFDQEFGIQHEVGVYCHESIDIPLDYPRMSNKFNGDPECHLERAIAFLGSCEYVITNSYHGAFWATLLGRKVIVVSPFSNKFLGFKFEPVIVQDLRYVVHHLRYLKSICRQYSKALADSRALTVEFANTVGDLIRRRS